MVTFSVVLLVLVFSAFACFLYFDKTFSEENAQREKENEEQFAQRRRRRTARDEFDVDVDPPYENQAYDEIVRIVNILAQLTANACVAQDKFVRSEKIDEIHPSTSWDDEVSNRKWKWSNKRNSALRICPELASRLPHFSEFEPLKSYREEHLQEKANKKAAA